MEEISLGDTNSDDTNWFYAELHLGTLTCLRWDGWRLQVPLDGPPGDLQILQSFAALPTGEASTPALGPLEGVVDFDVQRAHVMETGVKAPWFIGVLRADGVEVLRPNSWSITIPWNTPWSDVIRKLAVWSYLGGQLIAPEHIGSTILYNWRETGRYIRIGKYPFIQFSISPFWCESMN